MYNEKIETLISAALADGVLTEKEKQILFKRAEIEGVDLDEFEMVLDARLVELKKAEKEKVAKSAPKSDKLGDVKKCPACGAIVNSYQGRCVECGYIFENIQANLSSTRLFELLQNEKRKKERAQIISSFPIPITKGDLLEFITALHSKVFMNGGGLSQAASYSDGRFEKDEESAYVFKYRECLEKVKLVFPDDPMLNQYVIEFEKAVKQNEVGRIVMVISTASPMIGLIIAYLFGCGFWGYLGLFFLGCILSSGGIFYCVLIKKWNL